MTAERRGYLSALDRAYQLALRATGSGHLAEEAVQEACLKMARLTPQQLAVVQSADAYFLRVVHGTATDLLRSEKALKAREARQPMNTTDDQRSADALAADRELALAARDELAGLTPEMRVAVCLCCEQGLTHLETAEILEVPVDTVSTRVRRGLEALRERLAAKGFAALAAPELGVALGGLGVPAAPAALRTAAAKIGRDLRPKGSENASAPAGAHLKGGLIVKIGLGIAAVGLAAGGIFWAAGGKAEDGSAPLTAGKPDPAVEKVPGKDFPYGEGVVYRREVFLGSFAEGLQQDGPMAEIETGPNCSYAQAPNGDWYIMRTPERVIRRYDAKKQRVYTIAWGGPYGKRGGLAECARFGGGAYQGIMGIGVDKEGRLRVYDKNNKAIWALNEEKGTIEPTVDSDTLAKAAVRGVVPDGSTYYAMGDGKLKKLLPDGKTVDDLGVTLEGPLQFPSFFGHACVNEKLGRMYAACRDPQTPWGVIWYWDMKTGKATGIAGPKAGQDTKDLVLGSGPVDKIRFWCGGGPTLGPDNGERYVYYGGGDESTCSRIDLEKKYVTKMVHADAKDRSLWTFGEGRQGKDYRFGDPYNWAGCPSWSKEGLFYMSAAGRVEIFRPVEQKQEGQR